jgi:peptidoglycan/xylan/chitin deacetylase (PgdA/CDA1 family)
VKGLSLAVLIAISCMLNAQQPGSPAQPGIKWTEDQLRQAVAPARAGRKLTPKSWPGNARVAVCLSFDVDNESYLLARGETSPTTLSAGDFGAQTGLPRILELLDRYQIPASFFIPAVSAIIHPEMIPAILKRGRHEIGVHGWIHESLAPLEEAEEERLLNQAIDYLSKASGKRPVGYRAPAWAFSAHTLGLLRKHGFLYDSSLQAMDEPYEIVSNGEPTGLIELAIDWTLTETPYLGRGGTMPSPELLYQLYKDEFDGAYEQHTMFVLTLHPHVTGHRAPMHHLEKFIAYMKSKPGVWFATGEQIARACRAGW